MAVTGSYSMTAARRRLKTKNNPLFSTGASVRINLLGYLILEPYCAFPLQNGGFRNPVFGLNFVPGW